MKKKTNNPLTLSKIKIASLSKNMQQAIKGGLPNHLTMKTKSECMTKAGDCTTIHRGC